VQWHSRSPRALHVASQIVMLDAIRLFQVSVKGAARLSMRL
jgi:hypothetical protein